jgi:hypothetical protein
VGRRRSYRNLEGTLLTISGEKGKMIKQIQLDMGHLAGSSFSFLFHNRISMTLSRPPDS